MTLVEDNLSYQRKQSLVDHLRKQYPDFKTDIHLGDVSVMVVTGIYTNPVFDIPKNVLTKIRELKQMQPGLNQGIVGLAFDANYRIVATVLISGSLPAGTPHDYESRLKVRREMAIAVLQKDPSPYLINHV